MGGWRNLSGNNPQRNSDDSCDSEENSSSPAPLSSSPVLNRDSKGLFLRKASSKRNSEVNKRAVIVDESSGESEDSETKHENHPIQTDPEQPSPGDSEPQMPLVPLPPQPTMVQVVERAPRLSVGVTLGGRVNTQGMIRVGQRVIHNQAGGERPPPPQPAPPPPILSGSLGHTHEGRPPPPQPAPPPPHLSGSAGSGSSSSSLSTSSPAVPCGPPTQQAEATRRTSHAQSHHASPQTQANLQKFQQLQNDSRRGRAQTFAPVYLGQAVSTAVEEDVSFEERQLTQLGKNRSSNS